MSEVFRARMSCTSQSSSRSLDRQITIQDVHCLKEAFALFDIDREEQITAVELGQVLQLIFILNITL